MVMELTQQLVQSCQMASQKCHVPLATFTTLGARLGDAVSVETDDNNSALCSVWLQPGRRHVSFSPLVVKHTTHVGGSANMKTVNGRLRTLRSSVAESVDITVVVASSGCHGNKDKLKSVLQLLLNGLTVADGFSINIGLLDVAKTAGVCYVVINTSSPLNESVKIQPKTVINITSVVDKDRYEQLACKASSPKLAGLDLPRKKLEETLDMICKKGPTTTPQVVLLRGPGGCGKSSLVRVVAASRQAHLISVLASEIFGSRPGESESNLREVFQRATDCSQDGPCVLLLDDVDALCAMSKGEHRLVSQLCILLDALQHQQLPLLVVAATNRPAGLDPKLRRPGRLDKEIFIGIPTMTQRSEILASLTSDLRLSEDVSLEELVSATPGFVGADLYSLIQQSVALAVTASEVASDQVVVSRAHLMSILHSMTPSTQRGSDILVECGTVQWDSIGGLDDVKQAIKQAVEWPLKHADAFHRLGLARPSGVLLYGPPGCGKTRLVRAAATSCHVTFLSVSGAQLYSPFVGDSERKISEVFNQARAGAPAILFLDEIDGLIGGGRSGGVRERVLATLLTEMDGVGVRSDEASRELILEGDHAKQKTGVQHTVDNVGVLVVASTNRPDLLDAALVRPGRLDRLIYVPPPDLQARMQILAVHTANTPLQDVDLKLIAERTEHFTGADLENLCREAALYALSSGGLDSPSITQHHFDHVLQHLSPSISQSDTQPYEKLLRKSSIPET